MTSNAPQTNYGEIVARMWRSFLLFGITMFFLGVFTTLTILMIFGIIN